MWQTAGRRRATPLIFSAACIVAGCVLFAGAVHVHQHLCVPLVMDPTSEPLHLIMQGRLFLSATRLWSADLASFSWCATTSNEGTTEHRSVMDCVGTTTTS